METKMESRFPKLYKKFNSKDVANYTRWIKQLAEMYHDYKLLKLFDSHPKWMGLCFLMESWFDHRLVSKTDMAKHMIGMSRDGSLKFINHMIDTEVLFEHGDDTIKLDQRKKYLVPARELSEEWFVYIKERLMNGIEHSDIITLGGQPIARDVNKMCHKLKIVK